jgi:hypothetical protein
MPDRIKISGCRVGIPLSATSSEHLSGVTDVLLMRKLILKMSMLVGGVNGEINWIFRSVDEGAAAWTMETLWNASLHIMGSKTYRDMLAWWRDLRCS